MQNPDPVDALRAEIQTLTDALYSVEHVVMVGRDGSATKRWVAYLRDDDDPGGTMSLYGAPTADELFAKVKAAVAEAPTEYLQPSAYVAACVEACPACVDACPACDEGPGDCRGCGT